MAKTIYGLEIQTNKRGHQYVDVGGKQYAPVESSLKNVLKTPFTSEQYERITTQWDGTGKGETADMTEYAKGQQSKEAQKTMYTPTKAAAAKVATDEMGVPTESQFSAELQAMRGVVGDVKSFAGNLSETFSQQSESYKNSFEALQTSLGEQSELMQQQLETFQKTTGNLVNIAQEGFQEEVQSTLASGGDLNTVFEKYTSKQGEGLGEKMQEMSPEIQEAAKAAVKAGARPESVQEALDAYGRETSFGPMILDYLNKFAEKDPQEVQKETQEVMPIPQNTTVPEINDITSPTDQINSTLDNILTIGGPDMFDQIGAMDFENMNSADMLKVMMMAQIQTINDPTMNQYLNRMANRAEQGYQDALTLSEKGISEVNKAIDGKDFAPSTYEGLAAKIAVQGKDLQLESVSAEKKYRQEQYDTWLTQEQDKRGRLEGYLKAKLYASGAQDSTAGLQTMALQTNAADARLQSAQSEHNYAMSKLNIESRGIMMNYTNNVSKIAMDIEAKRTKAAGDYSDKLFEIEGMVIEDEREKRKLTMSALSEFNDKMYTYKKDQKDQAWKQYTQSYKENQDAIDNAYKRSGLTGTQWSVDSKGNMYDTGIATFENLKWQDSNALDYLNYNRNVENDLWDRAGVLLEGGQFKDAALLIGEDINFFDGYETLADKEFALSTLENSQSTYSQILGGMMAESGVINNCYADGTKGGQCGEFIHKFVNDYPYGLNTLQQKKSAINSTTPQVGSVVITNESYPGSNTGHVAMVNDVSDGYITLTESNYVGPELVSNSRKIPINDPKIQGYFNGTLNKEIQGMMTSTDQMVASKYYNIAKTKGIDTARKQLDQELGSGEEGRNVELAFNDLIRQGETSFFKTSVGEVATPWVGPSLEEQESRVVSMTKTEAKDYVEDFGLESSDLMTAASKTKNMTRAETMTYLDDKLGMLELNSEAKKLFYSAIKAYQ